MRFTRRDMIVAAIAGGAAWSAAALAGGQAAILGPAVFDWNAMEVEKTDVGALRSLVRQPTATLDELEMHVTTLNPGTTSHPPHTHPNEEMVIVREGTLQAHVNGKEIVVGPGSVLFFASMQPHAVQNVGDGPATYFVINWKSPGGGTRQIPKTPSGPSTQ